MLALWIVVGSIAGLALLIYAGFLAARYFFVPRYPDEIHFATTSDGWRLALVRYRPVENGAGPPHGEPVLLVHGIASNRYNLDLTDDLSLARYLAGRGYDVWLVELRGRGLSMRPRLFSGVHYDWSFDEYAERDLPAAAACVIRALGRAGGGPAPRLHLVGFSTGALACLAWLADPHRSCEVASLVAIGAATTFKRTGRNVSGRILRNLRWLRHRWLMRVVAPISGYWHPSPLQIIHNPENTDGAVQRRAMVNMIANFSRNELLQYSDWIMNDVYRSIDQRRDYRAELGRVTTPSLLLAGPRDVLAPPDAVKTTFEALGSTDKQFMICSRAQGLRVNYGHFDMVIGREAPGEIFPLIGRWLDAHRSGAEAAQPEPQLIRDDQIA
jgi:pimeloyl-ACP methyl ester carboxylesterase